MSGSASEAHAQTEATRARPLSGGLWGLISWLRRDDSGGSAESLSSVGSDRTVASFAFLAPDKCRRPAPRALPPPSPPTDSYDKRLRDRNSRLQYERDITLHRKYGLFRDDGYDAFSLPPARRFSNENKDREVRERRATSECLQRRSAHVPGKRRAPAPPGRSATLGHPRRSRKRPAPQPPRRPLGEAGRNATAPEEPFPIKITAKLHRDEPPSRGAEGMDYKPEKHVKKEVKDIKPRTEKSFLKQIFESRKRNSTIDAMPERILPSISELDKQAAEIIESCKLKVLDRSDERTAGTSREPTTTPARGDMWFCTRCLRKYDDSVVTCGHCVTEQKLKFNKIPSEGDRRSANRASNLYTQTEGNNVPSTSVLHGSDEKQKLKEMLKEIKDSLPKRPKHDLDLKENKTLNATEMKSPVAMYVEAPTLRIGTKISQEENKITVQKNDNESIHKGAESIRNDVKVVTNTISVSATETAVVTQPIVLQHLPSRDNIKLEKFNVADLKQRQTDGIHSSVGSDKKINIASTSASTSVPVREEYKLRGDVPTTSNSPLHTPLKISSLLGSNPPEEITRITLFSPSGNQLQEKTTNQTSVSLSAKPLTSSPNLQIDTNSNPAMRKINTPVATAMATKTADKTSLTSQEQTQQKPLKATTTTQTPGNILLDNIAKSRQNVANAKDEHNNQAINKPSNLEQYPQERKNSSALITPSAAPLSLSQAPISKTFTPLKPHVNNKEIANEASQQSQPSISNSPCIKSSEVPKVEIPRAVDHLQRNSATKIVPLDLHIRRRDLINQLEQSIAKGDEQAAADAAAKLAQLRLSCSVLSFSSQIVGAPSTSGALEKTVSNTQTEAAPTRTAKLEPQTNTDRLQNVSENAAASSSKGPIEKKTVPTKSDFGVIEKNKIIPNNKRQTSTEPSTSKQKDATGTENNIKIDVWIEDKEAARGPIKMNMPRVSRMGDLRRQASASFGLAAHLQRWIVGRTLCTDDNTTLNSLAGPGFDAPFYLCLVEPETYKHTATRSEAPSSSNNKPEDKNRNVNQTNEENKANDVYAELVLLERRAFVPNAEEFECEVCMEKCKAGQGAVLRECVHTFCRGCLSDVVKHSEEPAVSCPAMGCPGFLQEREIRALVSPEEYERWLARGLAAAESGTRNAFHCRTRDCQGWALCEPGVTRFPCPVCKRTNCVSCQAIHEGDTCEQYRAKQKSAEATNHAPEETDEGTKAFLDTLIARGEALECPECSAIITKKWGCDWIKCSACKTEICWVTRGRRWGPGGRGDTSAGCRCGVDGQRCHPSCGYCH